MCMSVLDRRVQVLVNPEQFAALELEAARTGRSVAAVIRLSIDEHLAGASPARAAAARLLAFANPDAPSGNEWSETKIAMAAHRQAAVTAGAYLVNTAVFANAVGGDHPSAAPCREIARHGGAGRIQLHAA